MNSPGDAFGFPFRSPGWLRTIVVQGLILIVPVIGAISLLGWLLLTLDNLRTGRQELAPAGFHLRRGIPLFGVILIYGLVVGSVPIVVCSLGVTTLANGGGAGLLSLAEVLALAAGLLSAFLYPVLILRVSRGGFSAGMGVGAVWRQATENVGQTMIAGLLIYVAYLIGELGVVIGIVGWFFGCAWSCGVAAGVVSWYERARSGALAQPT